MARKRKQPTPSVICPRTEADCELLIMPSSMSLAYGESCNGMIASPILLLYQKKTQRSTPFSMVTGPPHLSSQHPAWRPVRRSRLSARGSQAVSDRASGPKGAPEHANTLVVGCQVPCFCTLNLNEVACHGHYRVPFNFLRELTQAALARHWTVVSHRSLWTSPRAASILYALGGLQL